MRCIYSRTFNCYVGTCRSFSAFVSGDLPVNQVINELGISLHNYDYCPCRIFSLLFISFGFVVQLWRSFTTALVMLVNLDINNSLIFKVMNELRTKFNLKIVCGVEKEAVTE